MIARAALWLFLWGVTAVWAPLVVLPLFLRAEQMLAGPLPVLWFSVAAVPVFAGVAAARHRGGRPVLAGTGLAVGYLALSFATYRWGFAPRAHGGELVAGLPLAVAGAVVGRRFAGAPAGAPRLGTGIVIALLGAVLLPASLQRGADVSIDARSFPTGPSGTGADSVLAAAGRYGLYAVDAAPARSGCRVTGPGGRDQPLRALAVRPGTPGYDGTAATRWIAAFTAPVAGTYTLSCPAGGEQAYHLGPVPPIGGAVRALVLAPVPSPVIWLAGTLPGLVIVAAAGLSARARRGTPSGR